jgi:hypothetical protein
MIRRRLRLPGLQRLPPDLPGTTAGQPRMDQPTADMQHMDQPPATALLSITQARPRHQALTAQHRLRIPASIAQSSAALLSIPQARPWDKALTAQVRLRIPASIAQSSAALLSIPQARPWDKAPIAQARLRIPATIAKATFSRHPVASTEGSRYRGPAGLAAIIPDPLSSAIARPGAAMSAPSRMEVHCACGPTAG